MKLWLGVSLMLKLKDLLFEGHENDSDDTGGVYIIGTIKYYYV